MHVFSICSRSPSTSITNSITNSGYVFFILLEILTILVTIFEIVVYAKQMGIIFSPEFYFYCNLLKCCAWGIGSAIVIYIASYDGLALVLVSVGSAAAMQVFYFSLYVSDSTSRKYG